MLRSVIVSLPELFVNYLERMCLWNLASSESLESERNGTERNGNGNETEQNIICKGKWKEPLPPS